MMLLLLLLWLPLWLLRQLVVKVMALGHAPCLVHKQHRILQ
jgi:hypothetical protein